MVLDHLPVSTANTVLDLLAAVDFLESIEEMGPRDILRQANTNATPNWRSVEEMKSAPLCKWGQLTESACRSSSSDLCNLQL